MKGILFGLIVLLVVLMYTIYTTHSEPFFSESMSGSSSGSSSGSGSQPEMILSSRNLYDEITPIVKTEMNTARNEIVSDIRQLIRREGKSPSEEQGEDFNRKRCNNDECGPSDACDNDDYIRKDSIPCWSCNLPRNN